LGRPQVHIGRAGDLDFSGVFLDGIGEVSILAGQLGEGVLNSCTEMGREEKRKGPGTFGRGPFLFEWSCLPGFYKEAAGKEAQQPVTCFSGRRLGGEIAGPRIVLGGFPAPGTTGGIGGPFEAGVARGTSCMRAVPGDPLGDL